MNTPKPRGHLELDIVLLFSGLVIGYVILDFARWLFVDVLNK